MYISSISRRLMLILGFPKVYKSSFGGVDLD